MRPAGRFDGGPLPVAVFCSSPPLAQAARHELEHPADASRCHVIPGVSGTDLAAVAHGAALLLLPSSWHELATWLPVLHRRLASHPWLVLADLQRAGMFLTLIGQVERCTLLVPPLPVAQLRHAVQ